MITDVPAKRPVTQPVLPFMLTLPLLLLHVPKGVGSDKQIPRPLQTAILPVMLEGKGLTVNTTLDIVVPHELITSYTMFVVPPALPVVVTTPVTGSIVATPALLLLQPVPEPTGVVLLKIVDPW